MTQSKSDLKRRLMIFLGLLFIVGIVSPLDSFAKYSTSIYLKEGRFEDVRLKFKLDRTWVGNDTLCEPQVSVGASVKAAPVEGSDLEKYNFVFKNPSGLLCWYIPEQMAATLIPDESNPIQAGLPVWINYEIPEGKHYGQLPEDGEIPKARTISVRTDIPSAPFIQVDLNDKLSSRFEPTFVLR